jgi:hypothetical protein
MKRIAARLGVSASSVSLWTRDIELTPEQRHRNTHGERGPASPEHVAARAATWRRKNRERRRQYQEEGRIRAGERDPLHMAGCMLYWAEGTKKRNTLTLANSDSHMLSFFCVFLRESLGVQPDQITLRLNVYMGNGLPLKAIEDHWLRSLEYASNLPSRAHPQPHSDIQQRTEEEPASVRGRQH